MIRTVLKYVLIGMLVLLVGLWLWTGGFSRIANFVRTVPNPISILTGSESGGYSVALPWQLPVPQGADITGIVEKGNAMLENMETGEDTEGRIYDGTQSPFAGSVSLSTLSASAADPAKEYLVLQTKGGAPVRISGWSLQSQLTGIRVTIPLAAPVYMQGILNNVSYVELSAGQRAIISTGISPTGVSFRENRCTGYLEQTLSFEPSLANACPAPAEQLALEESNLQRYGGDCIDYVSNIPHCTFPSTIPTALSPACRIFVGNTYSYNGCVQTYRNEASFSLDTWRLYLGYARDLWRNDHDVIRLLDEYGRTVDSVTY